MDVAGGVGKKREGCRQPLKGLDCPPGQQGVSFACKEMVLGVGMLSN